MSRAIRYLVGQPPPSSSPAAACGNQHVRGSVQKPKAVARAQLPKNSTWCRLFLILQRYFWREVTTLRRVQRVNCTAPSFLERVQKVTLVSVAKTCTAKSLLFFHPNLSIVPGCSGALPSSSGPNRRRRCSRHPLHRLCWRALRGTTSSSLSSSTVSKSRSASFLVPNPTKEHRRTATLTFTEERKTTATAMMI